MITISFIVTVMTIQLQLILTHLEEPHFASGVQTNDPPKHPPVECIAQIREPVVEYAVHPPLQNDPVIAVQADAPRLTSSTRIRTVPKWHKDYFVSLSHIASDQNGETRLAVAKCIELRK